MEIFATRCNMKTLKMRGAAGRKYLFLLDKTWLGRQDSNLGMAESNSAQLTSSRRRS